MKAPISCFCAGVNSSAAAPADRRDEGAEREGSSETGGEFSLHDDLLGDGCGRRLIRARWRIQGGGPISGMSNTQFPLGACHWERPPALSRDEFKFRTPIAPTVRMPFGGWRSRLCSERCSAPACGRSSSFCRTPRPPSASTAPSASLPYALMMVGFAFGTIVMGRMADRTGIVVAARHRWPWRSAPASSSRVTRPISPCSRRRMAC